MDDEDLTGRKIQFEIRPDAKDPTRFVAHDVEFIGDQP
jgi:hypothetical protein